MRNALALVHSWWRVAAAHVSLSVCPSALLLLEPLQKWHPDKNKDNAEATVMFQKISEAYAGG